VSPSCAALLLLLLAVPLLASVGPSEYRVARTTSDPGELLGADAARWRRVPRITWGPRPYRTTFQALWGERGLSLRFEASDPNPWHTLAKRDEPLWNEEVVEIFLDPDRSGRNYYELEISPANVVCDLRMVSPWPDKEGDIDWDFEGLETRVHALIDDEGRTTGWIATAHLPWSGFRTLPSAREVSLPPMPGDAWRVNVFRIKRPGGPEAPDEGAVFAAWSPPSARSFHDPAAFRSLVFEGTP